MNAVNPLNAELNPIRHLLALVGVRHIVHVSRIRVNSLQLKNSYQRTSSTSYRTPRNKQAAFPEDATRKLHKQIVFRKGTNRLQPLNADTSLLSHYLSCISLVLALCTDMYIVTSKHTRSHSTPIKMNLQL